MHGKIKVLTEGALCVALSVVLSYVKLWQMPQGGSITLESVPLLLFALRHGVTAGIGAGALSGLLQFLTGGYMVHPVQAALDYPIAFGALGLAGFLPRSLWLGMALGTSVRFLCHVLSGVVFFGSYAPEGTSVWAYSVIYNGSYMLPSLVIGMGLVYAVWPRLSRIGEPTTAK